MQDGDMLCFRFGSVSLGCVDPRCFRVLRLFAHYLFSFVVAISGLIIHPVLDLNLNKISQFESQQKISILNLQSQTSSLPPLRLYVLSFSQYLVPGTRYELPLNVKPIFSFP